jgi:demethylspheroidene O-methyltransferase
MASGLRASLEALTKAWVGVRNRWLSSARFQRWAARSWLARGIARRRTSAMFDLTAGFVYSQVLHAVAKLQLLELLHVEPRTAAGVAAATRLPLDAALRLLDAAASLQLVQRVGSTYTLGIHGCSYVGNPAIALMVAHHELLYRDLADPVALLRGESPSRELEKFWSYVHARSTPAPSQVQAYTELMASSIALLAEDIIEAYPFDRHRCLLDVGGGEGAFLEHVARAVPGLELQLFDLPAVAARASNRLSEIASGARIRVHGGDWFRDPLPSGADVVSLVRVLHDHDDGDATRLLTAIRGAVVPGTPLVVAEPMRGTDGAERVSDAYFGLYLLAMGQGRPRSPQEIAALLRKSGFRPEGLRPTRRPMITRVLAARAE